MAKRTCLQFAARLTNADAVVLAEAVQKLNSLLQQVVPLSRCEYCERWFRYADHSRNLRRVFAAEVGGPSP
jgi:hypothetical protein